MNDSNNVLGNNNVTPTPQPDNANRFIPTSENNTNNNVNTSTVDANAVFGINTTPAQPQNEISQTNQNNTPAQPQPSFNSQINNTIPSNNINPTPVSPTTTVNPTPQPIQNANNTPPQQDFFSSNTINDDELLRAFIGNNYEKITTSQFNFAGFFFNSLYMCYRKMFGYGILTFLIYFVLYNIVNAFAPSLSLVLPIGICVAVGLMVNKIYLSYAKKKVAIIRASYPQKSNEELKSICADKGGTSVGKIFLGLLAQFGIALVALFIMDLIGIGSFKSDFFNPNNWNITDDGSGSNKTNTNNNGSSTNGTLLENVSVNGHGCMNSKCNVTIESPDGNSEDYVLGISNSDFFNKLGDYKDYIKLDIYYNKKGSSKTIVEYKIYLKSNNEDISSVSTESELRDKIGLYSLGTHTETMTLKEIGTTGFGFSGDQSYTYTEYTFVDSKNIEYEMKYKNDNGSSNLTEGKQYSVTFEVTEGTFDYEYYIQSIK